MTEVDARICKILAQMLEKKPVGQVITTAVAIKILDAKFKEAFGGLNFADKTQLIDNYLAENQKNAPAVAPKPAAAAQSKSESDSDSDDSDDEEDEEEEDEEDDESNFDESDEDEEEEEPAAKKLRTELLTGDIGARIDYEATFDCEFRKGQFTIKREGTRAFDVLLAIRTRVV